MVSSDAPSSLYIRYIVGSPSAPHSTFGEQLSRADASAPCTLIMFDDMPLTGEGTAGGPERRVEEGPIVVGTRKRCHRSRRARSSLPVGEACESRE